MISASSQKEIIKQVRKPAVRAADVVFVNAGDIAFNRPPRSRRSMSSGTFTPPGGVPSTTSRHGRRRTVTPRWTYRSTRSSSSGEEAPDCAATLRRHPRAAPALRLSADDIPGARSILEQRSVREIRGLCGLFGMTEDEVTDALSSIGRLIEPYRPVRVVNE